MEIIIKTGFEKITHDIQFQPATIPKGRDLVKAHHVLSVEEHRRNNKSYFIQAKVTRQCSVSSTPYSTQLNVRQIFLVYYIYK